MKTSYGGDIGKMASGERHDDYLVTNVRIKRLWSNHILIQFITNHKSSEIFQEVQCTERPKVLSTLRGHCQGLLDEGKLKYPRLKTIRK